MEGAAFRATDSVKNAPASGGKVTLTAAATLALDDLDDFAALQSEIEEVLKECARKAEDAINLKHLGGRKPSKAQCDKVVEMRPGEQVVTQAMRWGIEKHQQARECAEERSGELIPEHFSLEQRYRYEPATQRISLASGERAKGTLQPDIAIHSGSPLNVLAVYDFKFPCPEDNPPTWSRYPKGHPYGGRTQGEMYGRAFGCPPARVSPWWGIIRRVTW